MELCQSKKHIAIFSSLNYHYEMFGYIINYCKRNKHNLTIFTNTDNSLGWLEFYKIYFKVVIINYKTRFFLFIPSLSIIQIFFIPSQ